MKKSTRITLFLVGLLLVSKLNYSQWTPPVGCSNTNYANSFLNSSDPNTIEYDNIVSAFHGTMARQADGKVIVWGERMAHNGLDNVLTPQELNSTNYPGLTGDILKFTGSGRTRDYAQYCVLTTDGLFIWGRPAVLVDGDLTSTSEFQPLSIGMPPGVNPGDVKMLFGASATLAITTCSGNVWVLSYNGNKNGDGTLSDSDADDIIWHKVKTNAPGNPDLTEVVATRGSFYGLIALKSDGTVWTWGGDCFLGDGSPNQTIMYATQMTIPTGISPKMIGATFLSRIDADDPDSLRNKMSYYILSTDGRLFAIGHNRMRQLGDFTDINRTFWTQVRKSVGVGDYLTNLAWISPQEHSYYQDEGSSISALTADGTLYAWGNNDRGMLGGDLTITAMDPATNLGGLSAADKIIAVETGGHTSIVVKQCSGQYGYVGHRVNGSMGDGVAESGEEPTYNFTETAVMDLLGASSGAAVLFPVEGQVYQGQQKQLSFSPAGGTFTVTGPATVNSSGLLTLTGTGTVTVTYSITAPCPTSSPITLDVQAPLSVTFGDISASLNNGLLTVNWSSLNETNNDRFEIEASLDGKIFKKIGELESNAAEGNSSEPLNYTFANNLSGVALATGIGFLLLGSTGIFSRRKKHILVVLAAAAMALSIAGCYKEDNTVIGDDGKMFVRIAQVDKDGTRSYSKIVSVINK